MFEGVRDALKKAAVLENEIQSITDTVFPILNAEELLSTERRQQFLKALPGLSQLPSKEYQANYLSVVNNFAEFVQSLPQTKDTYFSYSGGLLDHGLERAVRALTLSRSFIAAQKGDPKEIIHKQALLRYAVFTAALLFDVGFVASKFLVTICDAEGKSLFAWHPYRSSMVGIGTHYKFEFDKQNWDFLRGLITPMLGRQIMNLNGSTSLRGFNWLSSDNEILETWFAMLREDTRQMSALLTVIPLAEAQTIANYFDLDRPLQEGFIQPNAAFWDNYAAVVNNFVQAPIGGPELAQTPTGLTQEQFAKLSPDERSRLLAQQKETLLENEKLTGTPVNAPVGQMSAAIIERRYPLVAPSYTAGLAFLRWILRGVHAKTLSVNQSNSLLHRVNEGLLLKNEAFDEFAKSHSQFKDPKQIRNQFAQLGFAAGDHAAGIVIKNPYLIFVNGQLPDINKNIQNILTPAASINEKSGHRPTKF